MILYLWDMYDIVAKGYMLYYTYGIYVILYLGDMYNIVLMEYV